jgi:uncharacterized protein involved in response to NO
MLCVWMAGRAAVTLSSWIGWTATAAIDLAFVVLVTAAVAREIVAGRNWRNLKVVTILGLLGFGNFLFHLEAHYHGAADYAIRLGIGVAVLLISLVGGRIVPSFTRNWLARHAPGRMPRPFGRYDLITMAASAVALLAWVSIPSEPLTGVALCGAGLLQLARLATWAGDRTLADPLVLILHIGYVFVPLGFWFAACAVFGWLPASAGIHAWTSGAIGTMTLAVMTRATLGHTGRPLKASVGTQAIYGAVVAGAVTRIGAAVHPEFGMPLITLSGITWAAAFLGFSGLYGPMLCRGAQTRDRRGRQDESDRAARPAVDKAVSDQRARGP